MLRNILNKTLARIPDAKSVLPEIDRVLAERSAREAARLEHNATALAETLLSIYLKKLKSDPKFTARLEITEWRRLRHELKSLAVEYRAIELLSERGWLLERHYGGSTIDHDKRYLSPLREGTQKAAVESGAS